jgi:UDP-N-acetylglucosamine 2-epimerase (non-hydrolysing)
MAPVVQALRARPTEFESLICLTAQHRGMLDQVMDCFDLSSDFDLDLMREGQSPADVAAQIMGTLPAVLHAARPDVLLVQGDTMTTLAAALCAFLNHVPVAHVEAGLRTGNFEQPFPEEMNRVLTSRIATLHFAPTAAAASALLKEGVDASRVILTGNTVIDALLQTVDAQHQFSDRALASRDATRPLALITTHRRESFGQPLRRICAAIATLAAELPDHDFVLPMHPNPEVRKTVLQQLDRLSNVILIEPLDYPDFTNLMARSRIILTDSGGVQEEAPSLNVPVLVLRPVTERPEGVAAGAARLVGTDQEVIVGTTLELLRDAEAYARMAAVPNPYGDGLAGPRIAQALERRFSAQARAAVRS